MFENTPLVGPQLVHRARNQQIVRTRLQSEDGQFFIDRPDWASVHLKRYDHLRDFLHDVTELGLQLVK